MKRCAGCGCELTDREELLCANCLHQLRPLLCGDDGNPMWQELCGKLTFEHAVTMAYYEPDNILSKLLRKAKFGRMKCLNAYLTELLLMQLEGSDWPYDIDLIVPVPIHWRRLLTRGYNQVGPIVETLSEGWHIPVEWGCLKRTKYLPSQVGSSLEKRLENQRNSLCVRHPERLVGKHILLVDDIYTTGSTLLVSTDLLKSIPGVRVSVLTLAMTLHV